MKPTNQSNIDIVVTHINHIIEKLPNTQWSLNHINSLDHCVLGVALEGEAFYTISNKVYTIRKGDCVFFCTNQERSATTSFNHPWHFISISFDLTFGDAESEHTICSLPPVLSSLPSQITTKCLELNHVWTGKRIGFLVKSRSLILDILYEIILYQNALSYNSAHYEKIQMVQKYIQENFSNDISVTELASLCNLSESHFRKVFRTITGMTSIQYINMIKINIAKDLLISGEANVSEAAIQTGFKDIFYFSRLFKIVTGEAPSRYKR